MLQRGRWRKVKVETCFRPGCEEPTKVGTLVPLRGLKSAQVLRQGSPSWVWLCRLYLAPELSMGGWTPSQALFATQLTLLPGCFCRRQMTFSLIYHPPLPEGKRFSKSSEGMPFLLASNVSEWSDMIGWTFQGDLSGHGVEDDLEWGGTVNRRVEQLSTEQGPDQK